MLHRTVVASFFLSLFLRFSSFFFVFGQAFSSDFLFFLFFDCGSWPAHCAPLLQFSGGHKTEKQR